jgi:anti-sigma regulatory factor (Ser/Thr protein kinase)
MARTDRTTIQIQSSLDAIVPANEAASAWLEAREVPANVVFLVNLAVEELVTNCIKYGYTDANQHLIDVDLILADGQLTMNVVDDGRAFNPLTAPVPDISLALEERPIGGLGLHLLRKLSDRMTYERRDNLNHVVLVKQF